MQVLEGVVGTVGTGTWEDGGGGGGGRTTLSVFEIGEHQLRRIVLPDHLRGHIAPGQRVRIMIRRGWSLGLATRPVIAAVEVNGTKAKVVRLLPQLLHVAALGSLVLGGVAAIYARPLAVAACVAIAAFYIKDCLQLRSF